jgi:starch-binding outer membrane protein, SusD/RagB family
MKLRHACFLKYVSYAVLMGCATGTTWSCNKAVAVNPPTTALTGASVYSSDVSAVAAVTGVYQLMLGGTYFFGESGQGSRDFTTIAGLSADEFQLYPGTVAVLAQAYANNISSTNAPFWAELYKTIYYANAAIAGLTGSGSITDTLKQQLLGEALFARAFCHFYLVNVFGPVPIVTTTNYTVTESIARSPVTAVYQQIIADLTQAQSLLSSSFSAPAGGSTKERTLPNQGAATAMLARAYLYEGKYDSAETEATLVINNGLYSLVPNLNGVFLINSSEAIWQLVDPTEGYNTPDGFTYILTSGPNSNFSPVYLSPYILQAFEAGDNRQTSWIGMDSVAGTKYYFPYKYKVKGGSGNTINSEYYMVLRLAEQYLIRSEAAAQLGDLSDAASDLNVIRKRAGLANISSSIASSQAALLTAILHERQVEFFCEFGHRWLDLVRTNNANAVLGSPGNVCAAKGGTWESTAQLFPLPATDVQTDPNLTQNPGYAN